MDEERHAQKKQKVCDGQAEDEDVWHGLLSPELCLFHNGVDDNAVAYNANEADDPINTGHEDVVVLLTGFCGKQKKRFTA